MSLSRLLKSSNTHLALIGTTDIPVRAPLVDVLPTPSGVDSEVEEVSPEEQYALRVEQSKQILVQAEYEANQTLEAARAQADFIRENAHQEGYRIGLEEGHAEARREFTEKYNSFMKETELLISQIEEERVRRLWDMHEIVVQIAMEAVRILLGRELELKGPDIEAIVNELIQYVIDSTRIEIRVHPADVRCAMIAHPKWSEMKFGDWEISIVPDLQIDRGGCEIRSNFSRIDAKIETKLELLGDTIRRLITQKAEGGAHAVRG